MLLVSEQNSFEQEALNLARFVSNLFTPVMDKLCHRQGTDICALTIRECVPSGLLLVPSAIGKLVHSIFIVFEGLMQLVH